MPYMISERDFAEVLEVVGEDSEIISKTLAAPTKVTSGFKKAILEWFENVQLV